MSFWWGAAPPFLSARFIPWRWTPSRAQKISVGPPYYALTFAPIFFALLLLVPFGPQLGWRRGNLKAALRALAPALGLAGVAAVVVLAVASPRTLTGTLAFAVAGWLIGASILDIRQAQGRAGQRLRRGLGACRAWRHLDGRGRHHACGAAKPWIVLGPGDTMTVGPYTLRFDGVDAGTGTQFSGVAGANRPDGR